MRTRGPDHVIERHARTPPSMGDSGRGWRALAAAAITVGAAVLLAETINSPSKRNIEVIGAIGLFLAFLASHPMRALYLAIILIPFQLHTSYGSTTTLLMFGVGALALAKAKSMRLDSPFVDRRFDMLLFGWVITMLLSFVQAPSDTMREAIMMMQAFMSAIVFMYTLTRLVQNERDLHNALRVFQVAVTLTAVIALLQSSFPDRTWLPDVFKYQREMVVNEMEEGGVRAFATYDGYESFAEFMALSVLLQFFLIRWSTSRFERLFWMAGVAACLLAVMASATRGALLSLGVAWVWMLLMSRGSIPKRPLALGMLGGFGVLVVAAFVAPHLIEYMVIRMSEDLTNAGSMDSRSYTWAQAIDATAKSPLIGHGLFIAPETFKGPVNMNIHNLYLHLAYTIGIPGLLFFLAMMFRLFQVSLGRAWDRMQNQFLREIMMVLSACMVLFAIDQLKIEYLRSALGMQWIWMLFGMIIVGEKLARRGRRGGLEV